MYSKEICRLSGPFTPLSSVKYYFLNTGRSHPYNTQHGHYSALQAYNREEFCCFAFPLPDIISFHPGEETMERFCAFPGGQISNKRPKPSFRVSPPIAMARNTSLQWQAPGEKSSGHNIPSLPLFPFSVLASWGQAEATTSQEGALFHSNAHFHCPNSEKWHYTRQYLEHTLKCCPEHGWTPAHV